MSHAEFFHNSLKLIICHQFGMGARSCVGKNIALVEIHKFIAQFFRHFDAKIINEERPWITKSQWFSIQKEFWVTISEREHKA